MSNLDVSLFGTMEITFGDSSNDIRLTRSMQGLFAFLILNRHRLHPRESLANLFWNESTETQARSRLNTALWRLRRAMENNGLSAAHYLTINHLGEIGFNAHSNFWLDVGEFERFIQSLLVLATDQVNVEVEQAFEHSLALYRGELLDGFYEDWVLRERERMRELYLVGLAFMMRHYHRTHAYEKSLVCGQRILVLDPLREEIHRAMMRLYLESGQRALALRQYEFCRQALEEELSIEPMEETQALYSRLHETPTLAPVTGSALASDRQVLERLLSQMEKTASAFDSAREQMQQLILTVKELL
jgi:DNA-binding SARP family transcriptional activator